jgi:hypothetical protein
MFHLVIQYGEKMIIDNLRKGVSTLLIILYALLGGCDRFHEAQVIIDPRKIKSETNISRQVTEEKVFSTVVISSVKEFASKLNLTCDPSQRPLFILDCGPHGTLNLRKEGDKFIITLFQMRGDSRYFCNVQGHMFEYFPLLFGESNVTVETTDACGRKNYP